jgi:hypothetical protein
VRRVQIALLITSVVLGLTLVALIVYVALHPAPRCMARV